MTKLEAVSFQNNFLSDFPDFGDATATVRFLYINDNKITFIDKHRLERFAKLRLLNLTGNRLFSIPDFTKLPFKGPIKISLMSNMISKLDPNVLQVYNVSDTLTIDLDKNPIHCDCRIQHVAMFPVTQSSNWTKTIHNLSCMTPANLKGMAVFGIELQRMICAGWCHYACYFYVYRTASLQHVSSELTFLLNVVTIDQSTDSCLSIRSTWKFYNSLMAVEVHYK